MSDNCRIYALIFLSAVFSWIPGILQAASRTISVRVIDAPGGFQFGMAGEKRSEPSPTVFFLATTFSGTLNHPLIPLCSHLIDTGFLCVSLDLPAHGGNRKPDEPEGLDGWRVRTKAEEPWLEEFVKRCSETLDYLVTHRYTKPSEVAIAGISRGGYIALQVAASDHRFRGVAAFSPVTDLSDLDEFHDVTNIKPFLRLEERVPFLIGSRIWISIGNNDLRVNTDSAIQFVRKVRLAALDDRRQPGVELHVVKGVSHRRGHQTEARADKEAANWILQMFREPIAGH